MMDLATGKLVPKSVHTKWDEAKHLFELTVTDQELVGQWKAGANPRVQIRFEGTVTKDAPTDHKVNNKWVLTLNNGSPRRTRCSTCRRPPSSPTTSKDTQRDPTISIDGKTALLGDKGYYRVNIDARQTDQAYKVWRLGMTDDYDDEYLNLDAKSGDPDETGKDYREFNIQDKDGVLYAYAKTVDTQVPATGETVQGDPQPDGPEGLQRENRQA